MKSVALPSSALVVLFTFLLSACGPSDKSASTDSKQTADSAVVDAGLAALEQNITRIRDINEIEKLQNTYGYYLDRSDWDNVVDLLTDDASAEYGPSGVFVGKDNVRSILYAIGYGKKGLQPKQIREHMQYQPVITLSADGKTAAGRWRVLAALGQFGQYARWQTGPYENEYRKENGVWKISKLHWVETFTVPVKGGMATKMAVTNVADRVMPTPTAPSTFKYEAWPAVSLFPFHFTNPVTAPAQKPLMVTATVPGTAAEHGARLGRLNAELQLLEDENRIRILQRTYGYYVDKNLWPQITELFADDGTLEIGGRGVFVGKPRILEYLKFLGDPVDGRLYDHTQVQPVVHVAADGKTAKGRWRAMIFTGGPKKDAMFGNVIYENEYRKEGDIWKITKLYAYFIMYSNLTIGWEKDAMANTRPEKNLPPDLPPTVVYDIYPGELTAPKHYPNPVTHAAELAVTPAPLAPVTESALPATLADLNRRATNLADVQAIERLQNAWGYYFDKWQWDDVAALYADNASSEHALRGIYVGKEHIKASLSLYGEAGLHQNTANENIVYQPVIHVSEDGNSAKGRFRLMHMQGTYGVDSTIGGSVMENEYIKENGIWKIKSDHLYSTFRADYSKGWVLGALPAPGKDDKLPADLPPSMIYSAFPAFYRVPFHYNNPVTGKPPLE